MNYIQCQLRAGDQTEVNGLPEKFAVKGKRLVIGGVDVTVEEVYRSFTPFNRRHYFDQLPSISA